MSKLPLSLFLLVLLPISVISDSLNTQRLTLLSIKHQWSNLPALSSWSPATSPCSWDGIQCSSAAGNSTMTVTGIYLNGASIAFTIPPSICYLKTLQSLDLSWNNIPGSFPTALYGCSSLTYLKLSGNGFVGPIPADVGRLSSSLEYLDLGMNSFTGNIPKSIGGLKALKTLYLKNNLLNGTCPSEISNLSKLEDLQMGSNSFTPMALPSEWGNLKSLKILIMEGCNLVGEIPESFGGLASLEILDLSENGLVGRIPLGLTTLSRLNTLTLEGNQLSGDLPLTKYNSWASLVTLNLASNEFSGTIPDAIGSLQNLNQLDLSNNKLAGSIPDAIGSLQNLTKLDLSNNKLAGSIPDAIGSLQNLNELYLSNNKLAGSIPDAIGSLQNLNELDLSNNKLAGSIPDAIGSLQNLNELDLSNNKLAGSIPDAIGSLHNLNKLFLSSNKFSGSIPGAIGSLHNLGVLYLSSNDLSGSILGAIGSLHNLVVLDLSSNDLSGEIPYQFRRLQLLSLYLKLSNNKLSGKIPHFLDKEDFAHSFFNTDLCTTDEIRNIKLPRCSSSLAYFFCKHLATILILAIVFLTTLFFIVFAIKEIKRRKHKDEQLPSWTFTPFQMLDFTESNIITSLSEQHIIGSGGSGKVYRVRVDNNSDYYVAVKRIWNNQQVNNAQFLAEVEILGKIRHANIVKLLCCISNESTQLLVYEYMENQSLDRWLHKRRRLESERRGNPLHVLDWPTRLRIAIGAAQGLCYMHHDCGPPIIHRDVKSSNILLDSEFNAKIADFGLARMTAKQGELHTVSSVAGSFGYLAPEYRSTRKVNEKIDVYSFGVVLLELVTGKEPNSRDETLNLADSSWRHCCENKPIVDGLDEEVMQEEDIEEMSSVFRLGLMCTSPLPNSRPSMKDVLQVLRRSNPIEEAEDGNRSSEQSPGRG